MSHFNFLLLQIIINSEKYTPLIWNINLFNFKMIIECVWWVQQVLNELHLEIQTLLGLGVRGYIGRET